MFWVWPTWENLNDGISYQDVTIPSGHSRQEFLAFEWPEVDGTFDDIYFWFAHLTPQGNLLGVVRLLHRRLFLMTGREIGKPRNK